MTFPTATYRLQLRNGMTFDRAVELVPYLKSLGISHFYASPIFTATTGSTHGYDVTDANEIDPAIGGRAGFDRLVAALKEAGLSLIIDIVPNHMASSLENPWWKDVVTHGEKSRYARHFDIDWSRRLTLPFLGSTFEEALASGDLVVKPDPQTGKPAFAYFESFYPLEPSTYAGRDSEVLATRDPDSLASLHDAQPYELMSWREASRNLSFRRFFEVAGLVGVRVEDEAVFADSHRLILDLVKSGAVQGLRIDHVDGLADPKAYVDRLRQEAGPDCYIVVEKILGEGEQFPGDWPVSGTTGYEFIAALSHAFIDNDGLARMRSAYEALSQEPVAGEDALRSAKMLMVEKNFEGEVSTLVRLATAIGDDEGAAVRDSDIKKALSALLIAFPVYRTYGTTAGLRPDDADLLGRVLTEVRRTGPDVPAPALQLLTRILKGDVPADIQPSANLFRTKFQQLTGPMMAKSIEDTLFYRQNMFLGINEVGADPLPGAFSLAQFHAEMHLRVKHQPLALSTTSTHDTKRGEDARARLYALSEAPEHWADAVTRWRDQNRHLVQQLEDGPAPEPETEWMLYQALAGVVPADFDATDRTAASALKERFLAYVEKALREAKGRTNWADPNERYETAVRNYAAHLLSGNEPVFLSDFLDTLRPYTHAGLVNGINQTVIKLMAPGVPDIYQGSEAKDFSLVDPDNRREPDFAELALWLDQDRGADMSDPSAWHDGSLKQSVVAKLLHLRKSAPDFFSQADYQPLNMADPSHDGVLAFSRRHGDEVLVVVLARFLLKKGLHLALPPSTAAASGALPLAEGLAGRSYRNMWTGEVIEAGDDLSLNCLDRAPFAVFYSSGT